MHVHQRVEVAARALQAGSLRRSREPDEEYQSGQSLHTSTSVPEWSRVPLSANYSGNSSTAFVYACPPKASSIALPPAFAARSNIPFTICYIQQAMHSLRAPLLPPAFF